MSPARQFRRDDDISAEEIAAVELVLRYIDGQHAKQRLLATLAEWFLALRMYKELELHFAQSKNRQSFEAKHRALLSSVMAIGDILIATIGTVEDRDLKPTGFTRGSILANARYLREKYEQWFVDVDEHTAGRVWNKVMDERPIDSPPNLPAKA